MSINVSFSMGGIKGQASIKDSAIGDLMTFLAKYSDCSASERTASAIKQNPIETAANYVNGDGTIASTKAWLSQHTPSEILNRIGLETNPDRILLLGAFHESTGEDKEGWKSADMELRFSEAKEGFPRNFPRDLRAAIEAGLIGAVTPRTYKVGRAGWNRIAEFVAKLSINQIRV